MKDVMAWYFPGLKKDTSLQNDRAYHILDRMFKNKSTPRCITMKLENEHKQKILEAIKDEISISVEGMKIRITEVVSHSCGDKKHSRRITSKGG